MKVVHRTYRQIKASIVNRIELFIFFLIFLFAFSGVPGQSNKSVAKMDDFQYKMDSINRRIDLNYYHIDLTNRSTIIELTKN